MCSLARIAIAALCTLALAWTPGCSNAASTPGAAVEQRTFASPEDAVVALIDAARAGDVSALAPIFGAGVEELGSDSPEVTEGDLQRLAAAYDRAHALYIDGAAEGTAATTAASVVTLAVGNDLWEFPVPMVRTGDGGDATWRFDTATGIANVRAMRIDTNEGDAAEFLLACIPAQVMFRQLGTLGLPAYAQRFHSDPGQRNGLWWPDAQAPPVSPLGPMVDEAVAGAGGDVDVWQVKSYRGFRYRILTAAGPSAPAGAANWLDANGHLVGGFAFVAWPDRYGETGLRTLLVSMDGAIWARDLGPETDAAVTSVTALDPGAGWVRCDVAP